MNIDIPKNTFEHKPPREDMVQAICDVFLHNKWNTFEVATRPFGETTKAIVGHDFTTVDDSADPESFIRESEMRTAFTALREAGYHVFRAPGYSRRTVGYKVVREDYCSEGWFEVNDLLDHWD